MAEPGTDRITGHARGAGAYRDIRYALAGLHLALLALYSCLAPGTMPARQDTGLAIVLCTGAGIVQVTLDENGEPVAPGHAQARCDWSVHVPVTAAAVQTGAATIAMAAIAADLPARPFAVPPRAFPRLKRPRAPPAFLWPPHS